MRNVAHGLGAGAAVALVAAAGGADAQAADFQVRSPGGRVVAEVRTTPARGSTFRVRVGGRTVLGPSALGLVTDRGELSTGLRVAGTARRAVRERYRTVIGPRRRHVHRAHELRLRLRGRGGQRLEVHVRATTDGAAYRYVLPGRGPVTVQRETGGFALPSARRAFSAPWTPSNEGLWGPGVRGAVSPVDAVRGLASAQGATALPFLAEPRPGSWVLLGEAGVDGRYAASHLRRSPRGPVPMNLALPPRTRTSPAGPLVQGPPLPVRGARPLRTPWRFVVAGSLRTVASSDMATDLAPPARVRDTRWIRPGTVAWSWPTEPLSPGVPARQREYVDFAARHGLEYVLIDAVPDPSAPSGGRPGTDLFGDGLDEFTARARRRGVGVLAWEHADRLVDPDRRRAILTRLARAGVAGVKVDFFDADHQGRLRLLDAILRETARLRLVVNLHGASLPTGLERTWPHVLTVEAVRGTEYHDLHAMLPAVVAPPDPRHEAIVPFTRNVMGPMDYTPAGFSEAAAAGRTTTAAHELALTVVFGSGLLHLADAIEEYARRPVALAFLRDVPTVWDESRLLAGSPGRDAVWARRAGRRWYVGVIDAGPARSRRVPLGFLRRATRYRLTLLLDGEDGLVAQRRRVTRDSRLTLRLPARGGAVLRLAPD
jgi:hypothetical protein